MDRGGAEALLASNKAVLKFGGRLDLAGALLTASAANFERDRAKVFRLSRSVTFENA